MNNMDSIALNNLKIINNLGEDPQDFNLVVDGKELSISEDENYDGIFSLKELEYPIFFSFNQLFNSMKFNSYHKIEGNKISSILDILNGSIDKLCLLLEKMEDDPHHDNFERIIDDIDNKYLIVNDRYKTCSFIQIYETMNDWLDSVCECLKECDRYLYLSENKTRFDMNETITEVNEGTEEENPNLQYEDDEIVQNVDKKND